MRVAVILLTSAVMGCKLSEVVPAEPGEPFLVVHGILNTRESRQFVTVEQTQGGVNAGVTGAIVTMTHLSPPGTCTAPQVALRELAAPQPGVSQPGAYITTSLCPLAPGDRVALRVESGRHTVTGTTLVPGARSVTVRGSNTVTQPGSTVHLDRTRDSIRIVMDPDRARAMEVEAVRDDRGGFVTFRLAGDTMGLTIAGDLVDPFTDDGRTVFRAGAYYLVTVTALDTNVFDFVRSGSDPFTGRGFINHLEGGVGVFGSVSPVTYELKVTAPQIDPREGIYRITGMLSGKQVSIDWDLYRDALTADADGFSGFVDGTWIDGPMRTSANALFPPAEGSPLASGFYGEIFGPPSGSQVPGQVGVAYVFSGVRAPKGVPFRLQVLYERNGSGVTDSVTAVQISGP